MIYADVLFIDLTFFSPVSDGVSYTMLLEPPSFNFISFSEKVLDLDNTCLAERSFLILSLSFYNFGSKHRV
jgi:hypothetical protein